MACPGAEAVSSRAGIRTYFSWSLALFNLGHFLPLTGPAWPSETKMFLPCTVDGSFWDSHWSRPMSGCSDSGWPETLGEDRDWYP